MISCQFALYALGVEDLSPAIDSAIAGLKALGLDLEVGSMSTQVTGPSDVIFEGLKRAFDAAAREGWVVMTATFSNACPLPAA